MVEIVHHKAALEATPHPPNSLEAMRACLECRADWVEIDVMALHDGDYLVVHGPGLAPETTADGEPSNLPLSAARDLRWRSAPAVRVPLLSEVVALWGDYPTAPTRLQIDYKNVYPFPHHEPLARLVRLIEPLGGRVLVSSMADWQLRGLRRLAPWLALGFDPHLHIDRRPEDYTPPPSALPPPPYRLGAYGYHDDSLLALARVWSAADYLRDRCETLIRQVPGVEALYLRHDFLTACLDDGFNWASALHEHGVLCAAYTLDATHPPALAHLARLIPAGVDRVTTNTPLALRGSLGIDDPA